MFTLYYVYIFVLFVFVLVLLVMKCPIILKYIYALNRMTGVVYRFLSLSNIKTNSVIYFVVKFIIRVPFMLMVH